ncbi:hypothetical protein F8388_011923 [Cannabis sativa]|uniref:Uncharacterized protein n=1 Tax=Cannabis sativa TaxID=3483 RepID=A0A7J6GDK0_CANSA|nr:hypothetical protein F8388_011923 [Cannabis sativa]
MAAACPTISIIARLTMMNFHFHIIVHAKQFIQKPFSNTKDVPKGYLAVYVGDENKMKRFKYVGNGKSTLTNKIQMQGIFKSIVTHMQGWSSLRPS